MREQLQTRTSQGQVHSRLPIRISRVKMDDQRPVLISHIKMDGQRPNRTSHSQPHSRRSIRTSHGQMHSRRPVLTSSHRTIRPAPTAIVGVVFDGGGIPLQQQIPLSSGTWDARLCLADWSSLALPPCRCGFYDVATNLWSWCACRMPVSASANSLTQLSVVECML